MNLIRIRDEIICTHSAHKALHFLQDLANIQKYEPKVSMAQVHRIGKERGFYVVSGFFAGIPWKGEFSYKCTEKGFHSEMLKGALAGRVRGGFVVSHESNDTCKIMHYEEYEIPGWLFWLIPFLRIYLQLAMKRELRLVARSLAEHTYH